MLRTDRKVIENIIAVYPYIFKWQDEIEKEQEGILGDMISPAKTVVEKLIALDNRRIDLCNLKVLYAFIERALGARFGEFTGCIESGLDSPLFGIALEAILGAGYDLDKARHDFGYLFKRVQYKRRKKISTGGDDRRDEIAAAVLA